MAALKLVVLSVCVALASAFVPMAAPLSRPAVASPACSGIVMIRAPPLQTRCVSPAHMQAVTSRRAFCVDRPR